jgi:hypothetical protein
MSYKVLQMPPSVASRRFGVQDSWSDSSSPALDLSFLQAWFEHNSDREASTAHRRTNWGALFGMALAVAVSAGCWAGLAWLVSRVW